jgi:hypothetical protein
VLPAYVESTERKRLFNDEEVSYLCCPSGIAVVSTRVGAGWCPLVLWCGGEVKIAGDDVAACAEEQSHPIPNEGSTLSVSSKGIT